MPSTTSPLRTLFAMYLGYGAMMLCRQTVVILSPALVDDAELGLSVADIGAILGWGTAGALVGKLVWGPLSDILGGRRTFLIGIALSAALIGAFGCTPVVGLFSALCFVLYGSKSAGWPAMTKLVERWYAPGSYGRVWGVLSTSSRASVVAGTLVLGALLATLSWRAVAGVSAGIAVAILAFCWRTVTDGPSDPQAGRRAAGQDEHPAGGAGAHPLANASIREALRAFAASPRVWLVCASLMALTVLMEFLSFVPLYLKQTFDVSPARAATASAVFPIGSLLAVLVAGFVYDKLSERQLRIGFGVSLGIASAVLAGLLWLPAAGLDTNASYGLTLAAILLFGAAISPAYYLPMSIFSIRFGGRHSGLLVCLIDVFGFFAAMIFDFAGGRIADGPGGWDRFLLVLLAVSFAAIVSTVLFLRGEQKANDRAPSLALAEAA